MIVAMHIMSESCDHYVELFVNKTVEEIKQELYDGMEWFYPVSTYDYTVDKDSTTSAETKELEKMLSKWHDDSWNYDESEEDEE